MIDKSLFEILSNNNKDDEDQNRVLWILWIGIMSSSEYYNTHKSILSSINVSINREI